MDIFFHVRVFHRGINEHSPTTCLTDTVSKHLLLIKSMLNLKGKSFILSKSRHSDTCSLKNATLSTYASLRLSTNIRRYIKQYYKVLALLPNVVLGKVVYMFVLLMTSGVSRHPDSLGEKRETEWMLLQLQKIKELSHAHSTESQLCLPNLLPFHICL